MVAGRWRAFFLVGGEVGGLWEGVHDLVVEAQVQDLVSFPLRQQWVCRCQSNDAEPKCKEGVVSRRYSFVTTIKKKK